MRAGFDDLRAPVDAAHAKLLDAELAVLRADREAQFARADRDGEDNALDDIAGDARAALAGRGRDAVRTEPYKAIFAKGIAEFVDASLEDQVAAYNKLSGNLVTYLRPDDPVRCDAVPKIASALEAWKVAEAAVQTAETAVDRARYARAAARAAWDTVMVATYGALLARVGKTKAARFFPKRPSSRKAPAAEAPTS